MTTQAELQAERFSAAFGAPTPATAAPARTWAWGELRNGGIRICQDCFAVTLEDEMHLCPGSG